MLLQAAAGSAKADALKQQIYEVRHNRRIVESSNFFIASAHHLQGLQQFGLLHATTDMRP